MKPEAAEVTLMKAGSVSRRMRSLGGCKQGCSPAHAGGRDQPVLAPFDWDIFGHLRGAIRNGCFIQASSVCSTPSDCVPVRAGVNAGSVCVCIYLLQPLFF